MAALRTGSTRRWRVVRQRILRRDNFTCQIRRPGCTVTATEVDHILPVSAGGSLYDRSNLQAACFMCNRAKGDSVGPTCEVCGTSQHLFYGPTERAGGHTLLPQDGPASREW